MSAVGGGGVGGVYTLEPLHCRDLLWAIGDRQALRSEAGYYLRRALRLAPHRDDLRQLHDQTISISERFEAVTQREIWLPPVEQEDLPTQGSDDPAWPQANP